MEVCIEKIIQAYSIQCTRLPCHSDTLHTDIQFKAIKDRKILKPLINVVSRGEHVPDIKQFHRVLKERAQCYFAMVRKIGITSLPKMSVIHLMITMTFYVNAFV